MQLSALQESTGRIKAARQEDAWSLISFSVENRTEHIYPKTERGGRVTVASTLDLSALVRHREVQKRLYAKILN